MKGRSAPPIPAPLTRGVQGALAGARRHVRPAYGTIAVAVTAALALAGSQLLDYRGISIGAPAYAEVEGVASAPEIDRERASAAHGFATYAIALAALAVVLAAARGRWRAARLLVPLGLAAVVVSVAVDAPAGLDEEGAALAYEGAEAVLLEGFWAQVVAGAALACCGPLLAVHLRAGAGTGRRHRHSRARSRRATPPGASLWLCAANARAGGRELG